MDTANRLFQFLELKIDLRQLPFVEQTQRISRLHCHRQYTGLSDASLIKTNLGSVEMVRRSASKCFVKAREHQVQRRIKQSWTNASSILLRISRYKFFSKPYSPINILLKQWSLLMNFKWVNDKVAGRNFSTKLGLHCFPTNYSTLKLSIGSLIVVTNLIKNFR